MRVIVHGLRCGAADVQETLENSHFEAVWSIVYSGTTYRTRAANGPHQEVLQQGKLQQPRAKPKHGKPWRCSGRRRQGVCRLSCSWRSCQCQSKRVSGTFKANWYNPVTGATTFAKNVSGGSSHTFSNSIAQDWVLHITMKKSGSTPPPPQSPPPSRGG